MSKMHHIPLSIEQIEAIVLDCQSFAQLEDHNASDCNIWSLTGDHDESFYIRNNSRRIYEIILMLNLWGVGSVCKMLADALCPKGLLVVEVPDVSGGQARLRGRKWQHWLPHHVNYFNLATLSRILVPMGLQYAGIEVKYHLTFPQGIVWRDAIHAMLAHLGLHDIITTYWLKRR